MIDFDAGIIPVAVYDDVGRMNDGGMFPPKFIENKLKFFPFIKEAVAFGHERDMVTAMISIDLEAVGNWAERNGLAYGGYQDLAAREGRVGRRQLADARTGGALVAAGRFLAPVVEERLAEVR